MVRALLLGLLTISAVASCKGEEGGPAVQAGVAAGKVVELSGTVTARRGTESRTLVSGNEVSGDDVIETGADSTISIVLAHNNAVWSLGPNKREKVAESMAWSLAKVDKPALGAVESTSAAGRHAERSGASTSATASEDNRAEPALAEPSAAVAPGAPAATPTAGVLPSSGAPAAAPSPAQSPPPPPPPPPAPRNAVKAKGAGPSDPVGVGVVGAGGGGAIRGGSESGTAATTATRERSRAAEPARDALPPPPPPAPPAPAAPAPAIAAEEAMPEIQVLANSQRDQMAKCLDTTMKSLAVTLVVEQGKARFKLPAGTAPAVASCLAKVAAEMKPSAGLTASLAVTIK